MEELGNEYPEYDDMDYDQLNDRDNELDQQRLDLLRNPDATADDRIEILNREKYIDYLRDKIDVRETSFTDSNDNKTVTITRRENRIASAHEIVFTDTHALPDNIVGTAIEGFISKEHNIGNFKFDDRVVESYELRSRVGPTEHNNITFKPRTTRNKFGQPQIVLKRDNDGALKYNTAQVAQKAVTQFKELIDVTIDNQRERETLRENMPMVDIDTITN